MENGKISAEIRQRLVKIWMEAFPKRDRKMPRTKEEWKAELIDALCKPNDRLVLVNMVRALGINIGVQDGGALTSWHDGQLIEMLAEALGSEPWTSPRKVDTQLRVYNHPGRSSNGSNATYLHR